MQSDLQGRGSDYLSKLHVYWVFHKHLQNKCNIRLEPKPNQYEDTEEEGPIISAWDIRVFIHILYYILYNKPVNMFP